MSAENKTYLGDSVYSEYLGGGVFRIYQDNGDGEHDSTVLEPEVMAALDRFKTRMMTVKEGKVSGE